MTPIDLYRIVMASRVWTMTQVDTDQFYDAGSGNERYVATTIGRGEITQKSEVTKANLEVRLPIDHSLSVLLLSSFFEQVVTFTLFTNRAGTTEVTWKGRLTGIKPDEAVLTLNFESVFTSIRRQGLRPIFMRSCRHALYGRGCKLNPASFADAATISAISGSAITVPAAASQVDGFYTGGMIAASDGTKAFIVNHVGNQLTVWRVPYALASDFATGGVGTSTTIYRGCDHTRTMCNSSKFSNGLNYGGFDWIPVTNPFGGTSIV